MIDLAFNVKRLIGIALITRECSFPWT